MSKRETLGFEEATARAFDLLEKSYGFRKTLASEKKVRYESEKVYIEINYGDYDYELSLAFGRLNRGEPERFDFTLFLRLVNPTLEQALGERIADKPEAVRDTLHKLAEALQTQGMDIITGNDVAFERMKSVRWWHFKPEALGNKGKETGP
jgi:hypothetical protein